MLVNSNYLFKEAQQHKFAIPAANFIDIDSARVFTQTAEKENKPLILAFAQSHSHIISLEEAALVGKFFSEKLTVPIVLHLDHGEDFDFIKKAIDFGFTSVMIDASQESFEDNISITKKVVDYAHQFNVSVEAELGHVGSNDLSESNSLTESVYTEVSDVLEFIKKTSVDSLAISIGTAHGVYKGTPHINFDRLKDIKQKTNTPLVLHGGSSSGDENLSKCAQLGISKINIYTDFLNGAMNAIEESTHDSYIGLKNLANKGMEQVLTHYYKVFKTQEVRKEV